MKTLNVIMLSTILFTLVTGCRTAQWHLTKALDKGLKIDTFTRVSHDTILVSAEPFDHTFDAVAEADTVYIKELCKDPVKNLINRKFSREVCPQLDTTYYIGVEVQDTVYHFPVDVLLVDGTYKFATTLFKIPYVTKTDTDVNFITPPKGFSTKELIWWSGLAFLLGLSLALLAVVRNRRVRDTNS